MEEDIKDTLILFKMGLRTEEESTKELLNLFNVKDSFVEEYVEHCLLCRENGLPMLDWYSYQKQYCI